MQKAKIFSVFRRNLWIQLLAQTFCKTFFKTRLHIYQLVFISNKLHHIYFAKWLKNLLLFWKWLQGQSGEINFFGQCQRTFSLHRCNLILNYWPINTQKLRNKTYASTISEKYDVCLKGIIYHLWIRLDSLECRK